MPDQILVTPAQLRDAAEQLQQAGQRIHAAVQAVDGEVQRLAPNIFDGQLAAAYRTDFVSQRDTLNGMAGLLTQFAAQLEQAASAFEVADRIDSQEEDGIGIAAAIGIGVIAIIGAGIAAIIIDEKNVFEKHPEPGKVVVGSPDSLKKHWEKQVGNRCGYYATRNILKAFGQDVPIADLQQQAGETIGDEGTAYGDYELMFEANGVDVDAHPRFDSREDAMRSLENDIRDNKGVLARIDVNGLDQDWPRNPLETGGHAIWVTGMRYDDQGNLTHVICNDSAKSAGIEYPAAEFLDAWQGREYSYIASKDPMTDI